MKSTALKYFSDEKIKTKNFENEISKNAKGITINKLYLKDKRSK